MTTIASMTPELVVFSDLDGTLLDHDNYSFEPALPALVRMKAAGIPLVLASSKTAAEMIALRKEMGFSHCPAIVENGAGLLAGGDDRAHDRSEHVRLRAALQEVTAELRAYFEGFTDWGVDGIARHTGLPLAKAALASERGFSEPGVWNGTDAQLDAFLAELGALGISARQGGRYLTLSFGGTKAGQMDAALAALGATSARCIALGDAPNDVEMLAKADHGYIIQNEHGAQIPPLPEEDAGSVSRVKGFGPEGWCLAVENELDRLLNGDEDRSASAPE